MDTDYCLFCTSLAYQSFSPLSVLSFQCFALDMLAMCGPEMWFYEELFFYRVCFSRMVARNDPPLFLNVTVSVIDLVSASHPLVTAAWFRPCSAAKSLPIEETAFLLYLVTHFQYIIVKVIFCVRKIPKCRLRVYSVRLVKYGSSSGQTTASWLLPSCPPQVTNHSVGQNCKFWSSVGFYPK